MTNIDFKEFCKKALKKPVMYMWGTFGNPITEKLIAYKSTQSPTYAKHYSAAYQKDLRDEIDKGIGCDCTGLIKWFLWTGGDIEKLPKYDKNTDNAASGWYNVAIVRGLIATMPEQTGLILSYSGHCGVYVGNGNVIECTRGEFGNGVVQTKITDRKWEKWCQCPYITYVVDYCIDDIKVKTCAVRVTQDCPTYATINLSQKYGTVYYEDEVQLIGVIGRVAAIIYPTAATLKIAFVEKDFIRRV